MRERTGFRKKYWKPRLIFFSFFKDDISVIRNTSMKTLPLMTRPSNGSLKQNEQVGLFMELNGSQSHLRCMCNNLKLIMQLEVCS